MPEVLVQEALAEVKRKKNPAALDRVRFESFDEGTCAQVMHLRPFTEEVPTIARLHRFIETSGYAIAGTHHEIYLSDIRKAAPAQWKTITRQPIR